MDSTSTNNVIYQAKVSAPLSDPKIYIGMAESQFKTRYNNHKLSFKKKKYAKRTALSNHVWDLKEKQLDYTIKWCILKRAGPHTRGVPDCSLCLAEK